MQSYDWTNEHKIYTRSTNLTTLTPLLVRCVSSVLAIEMLAACQGIEFLRPLHTTTPLEKVYDLVRSVVK